MEWITIEFNMKTKDQQRKGRLDLFLAEIIIFLTSLSTLEF